MFSGLRLLACGLLRNLLAAVRLALFLRVTAADFRVGAGHLIALLAFNLAIWFASDWLFNGPDGTLNGAAIATWLAQFTVVLFAAALIAGLFGDQRLIPRLALLWYAPDFVFELIDVLLAAQRGGAAMLPAMVELPDWFAEYAGWTAAFWQLAVMIRAVAVATRWRTWRMLPSVLVVLALSGTAATLLPRTELWQAAAPAEGEEEEEDNEADPRWRA